MQFAAAVVGLLLLAGLALFPGSKVAASPAGAAAAVAPGWLPQPTLAWGGLLLLWGMIFFSFELSQLVLWGLRRHAYKEA
jgi:hypothetical protein